MKDQIQRNRKRRQGRASAQVAQTLPENNAGKKPGGVTEKGFMPGHSGNPGGRPKGSVKVSSCYERSLSRPFPSDPVGRTYAQVIADKAVELAADGRIDAIKEVTDRTEGRSKQTIDVNRSDLRREYLRRAVDELSAKYGKPREEVVRDIAESEPDASEWLWETHTFHIFSLATSVFSDTMRRDKQIVSRHESDVQLDCPWSLRLCI